MLKYKNKIIVLVLLGIMATNFAVAQITPNVGDTSTMGDFLTSSLAAIGKSAYELSIAATTGGTIYILNGILFLVKAFLGALLFVVQALAQTALTAADIGNNDVVNIGWALSRDIANMFFILILLIIAFGTILRIEGWGYEKLLPKLIIAAFLINFSKVITLALIDASQILTLFFMNLNPNFSAAMADAFNLNKLGDFAVSFVVAPVTTYYSLLTEIVFKLLTILAYGVLAFLFMVRIVTFWFLIVLAPFVWLLGILPKFQKYTSMWWEKFIKWLVFAPVASFLIYLSVITMKGAQAKLFATANILNPVHPSLTGEMSQFFPSIMQPNNFLSAVLAFMFLFGSMYVAQMTGNAAPGVFFAGAKAIKGALPGAMGKMGKRMFMKEAPPASPPSGRIPPLRPSVTSPGQKPEEPPLPSMGETGLTRLEQMEGLGPERFDEQVIEVKRKAEEERKRKLFGPSMMKSPVLENIRQQAILMKEKMIKTGKDHPLIQAVVGDFFVPIAKASLAGTGIFKKEETKKERKRREYEESIVEENQDKTKEKEPEEENQGETT